MKGVWILAFVLAACAAGAQKSAAPVVPNASGAGDPRQQIEDLAQQIEGQRAQLGLPVPGIAPHCPDCGGVATTMSATLPWKSDPQCHPGQSDTCTQSCTVSDSICSNSTKICDLAGQLPGDNWAAGKCDASKQTCAASHEKCCACSP